jgi:hypothetical protein
LGLKTSVSELPPESLNVYVSIGCGRQTFVPFNPEMLYLIPMTRVSPGVAPVTDIVNVPVVGSNELVDDRFPQLALYRLTCPRFWGASGGQFGKLHALFGAIASLTVIVNDAEGAMSVL